MMIKRIAYISVLLLTAAFASISPARAEQERDPFFSAGPRSSAPVTSAPDDGTWGRDPFNRPFEGAEKQAPPSGARARGPVLTGIIYSKDVRLAILGGETFREGSVIGDRKLSEIRAHSVVFLNSAGGTEEVSLEDFSIRK
jgi:hypothetical protein